MLTIHRWFNIEAAVNDLKYEPVIGFEQGWEQTLQWFADNKGWWIAKAEGKKTPQSAAKSKDA